jgi:translocator protein
VANASAPSFSTILGWATLVVIALNMAFIADYNTLGEAPTITEVAAEYGLAFVPLGFAKALGAALVGAFLFFYFAALWPRRRRVPIYSKFVIPLALTSVLAAGWIVAFRHEEIGLSTTLVAASVFLGGVMFVRAAAASPGQHSGWLRVPFSLHFAAMTIAVLVAVTQWLNASGLLAETPVAPEDLASAFLMLATTLGGLVALRYNDFVYPAVIASGAGAMFIATRSYDLHIAVEALTVCVGMLAVVVLAAVALAWQPQHDPKRAAARRSIRRALRVPGTGWYLMEASSSFMRF